MIKFKTVGMFDVSKNDPTIKAHAEIPNGYFCTVADGKTVQPDDAAAKGPGLKLVVKNVIGDDRYVNVPIAEGEYVVAYDLEANGSQRLIVTQEHVAADISTLAVDGLLGVDANGKLAEIAAATGYALYFKIVAITSFGNKKAVDVEIVNASASCVVA